MRKSVIGFEGFYEVDELGNFFNSKTGRIKKQCVNKYGYYHVTLRKPGLCKTFRSHRLVALAFINNPDNYEQVNHINGIKTDNRVENLEWCNNSMNQKHSVKTGLRKVGVGLESCNPRVVVHTDYGVFLTIKDAASFVGMDDSTFTRKLNAGKTKFIFA